jgi:hypothetical protein
MLLMNYEKFAKPANINNFISFIVNGTSFLLPSNYSEKRLQPLPKRITKERNNSKNLA